MGSEIWREKVSFGVLGWFPVVCLLLTASKSPKVGHDVDLKTFRGLQVDELGVFGVMGGLGG